MGQSSAWRQVETSQLGEILRRYDEDMLCVTAALETSTRPPAPKRRNQGNRGAAAGALREGAEAAQSVGDAECFFIASMAHPQAKKRPKSCS